MKTIITLVLLFTFTAYAQWEKLPLYGGHAEKLVQSKFNPNDIFAITAKSGVWYSSDGGKNWRAINGNKSELIGKDITDIEVAKDSSLFITMNRKLFRSRDWGRTWIEKIIRADIQFYESNIEANLNGDLFVYATKKNGSGAFLFKSIDVSETWLEYTLPNEADWRFTNYYIDPTNEKIIFLFGSRGFLSISIDDGNSWQTIKEMKDYRYIYTPVKYTDGSSRYGVWAYYDGNPFWYDYFESQDSGRTWYKKNINPFLGPRALSKLTLNTIHFQNSLFTPSGNAFYESSDDGVTWEVHANVSLWDILYVNDLLIGSLTLYGIKVSTDSGNNWNSIQVNKGISALSTIEFVAINNVIFAIVSDDDGNDTRYQFRQSIDGGNTWKVLFDSPSLHSLCIVSSSPPRYKALSRNSEIITGTIDQTDPDTLMKGTIIPLYNLRVSATDSNTLFCLAGSTTGRMLYVSTDGGKNWDSTLTPLFDYRYFGLYPSRVIPERVIFIGVLARSIDILGAGIFLSNDYGNSARMIVNEDLKALHFRFFGNDILFDNWNYSFSTDYGVT